MRKSRICLAGLFFAGGCGGGMVKDDGGSPTDPCDQPGVICTVAGTGLSAFDGDGRPPLETSFYFPLDVLFDQAGQPLILDWNNVRIRRINEAGVVETIMGTDFEGTPTNGAPAKETPLHHASDIEFDDQMRLFVAGDHVPVVFRVDTDQRVFIIAGNNEYGNDGDGGAAVDARLGTPFGVVPDDRGGFYIADSDAHVIRYVDASGTITTVAGDGTRGYSGDGGPGRAAQLNGPSRMRLEPAGGLLICDTENNVVRRLDAGGVISTFAGTGHAGYSGDGGPATAARFTRPYDVNLGPDGAVYVADTGNHAIRRVGGDGVVTTVVGTGVAAFSGDRASAARCQLNGPSSVTFSADGSLWISDTYNQRVRRVSDALSLVSD